MRRPLLAAAAAFSMITASTGALAQSAAPLSLGSLGLDSGARAGADLQEAGDLRGGFILPTLAIVAIIALVLVLSKDGDPSSP